MSSEDEPKKKWRDFLVNQGATLVVGLLIGILGTSVTNYLSAKDPHLTYTVSDPVTYQGEKVHFSLCTITVENDGNKVTEKIKGQIRVDGAQSILESNVTPQNLKGTANKGSTLDDANVVTVEIPNLNPQESAQISIITPAIKIQPEVDIRTPGAEAIRKELARNRTSPFSNLTAFFFGMLVYAVLSVLRIILEYAGKKDVIFSLTKAVDTLSTRIKDQGNYEQLFLRTTAKKLYLPTAQLLQIGREFSMEDFKRMTDLSEGQIRSYLNEIESDEIRLGCPVLTQYSNGNFRFYDSVQLTIRELIEKYRNKEGWREFLPPRDRLL